MPKAWLTYSLQFTFNLSQVSLATQSKTQAPSIAAASKCPAKTKLCVHGWEARVRWMPCCSLTYTALVWMFTVTHPHWTSYCFHFTNQETENCTGEERWPRSSNKTDSELNEPEVLEFRHLNHSNLPVHRDRISLVPISYHLRDGWKPFLYNATYLAFI